MALVTGYFALSPLKSDQHLNSPYHYTTQLNIKVMRIQQMITK